MGEEGFLEVFSKSGNSFKYKNNKNITVPLLHEKYVSNISIKLKNILKNIKTSNGIVFIYTDYIWSGAIPLPLNII